MFDWYTGYSSYSRSSIEVGLWRTRHECSFDEIVNDPVQNDLRVLLGLTLELETRYSYTEHIMLRQRRREWLLWKDHLLLETNVVEQVTKARFTE